MLSFLWPQAWKHSYLKTVKYACNIDKFLVDGRPEPYYNAKKAVYYFKEPTLLFVHLLSGQFVTLKKPNT